MIQVIPISGHSNTQSVLAALEAVGLSYSIVDSPSAFSTLQPVLIPGLGRFVDGIRYLEQTELSGVIREHGGLKSPMVGICLGMQLLFSSGSEGITAAGLGIFAGEIKPFPNHAARGGGLNIGWGEVRWNGGTPSSLNQAYFSHSFRASDVSPGDILAESVHNAERFPSAVQKNGVVGLQFHPELSGAAGIALLKNFLTL